MDTRSSRYLSLDAKGAEPPTRTVRDRHNSAPTIDRRKDQHQRRTSTVAKAPDFSHRSTKSHGRNERVTSPDDRSSTRHSDRRQVSGNAETRSASKASENEAESAINLLVLGCRSSGKTTFIRNALAKERARSWTQVVIKDKYYRIRLIELSFDDVDFSSESTIEWPSEVNGAPLPEVDGVFCLYDVADKESVADIPAALTSMTNTGVPCMLVAAKCDVSEKARQVSPGFHEQVRRNLAKVAIAEISITSTENTKQCFMAMIHRVIASPRATIRASKSSYPSTETSGPRRLTSRDPSPRIDRSRSRSNPRLQASKSKELLLNLTVRPALIESENEESDHLESSNVRRSGRKTQLRLDTATAVHPERRVTAPHTPVSSGDFTSASKLTSPETTMTAIPETPDSYFVKNMLCPDSTSPGDKRVNQTFLDMDEEAQNMSPRNETDMLGLFLSNVSSSAESKPEVGVPFQDLVDKLLLLPANKLDSKFVPSFLCLYRAFTTPQRLLTAIIDQFMKVEGSKMVHFTKVAEMLRYLQVLAQWTAIYPGDFAPGTAREIAIPFVQSIEKSKVFAPAAREISNNLDTIILDEDADWALDDSPTSASKRSGASSSQHKESSSSSSLPLSNREKSRGSHRRDRRSEDESGDEDGTNSSARGSNAPSTTSSMMRSNQSSQSYANFIQLKKAKHEAERFKPIPRLRMGKMQWHQFMETPLDDIAKEITRIDWAMYSAIRPRDYVRHVSLSTSQRRQPGANDNIASMVKNFNHLALFVSGMILLRDKPKHRAKALEKFMALAWKVRQLNNYNSLGALVAGITGHEISRLNATRELISPEVQKQFLRLTILMGISRKHAAYRMAWDNSPGERIPFLPLVRQDLTMTASANPTFIGTNINWKKFEIMGEVIVGIQRSLENPYNFPTRSIRTDEIDKLLLETRILEESEDSADPRSELYDRSVQVEPQQTGLDPRKKFDWLRR